MDNKHGFTMLKGKYPRYNNGGEFGEFPRGKNWEWAIDEARAGGIAINGETLIGAELETAILAELDAPYNRSQHGANAGQWMSTPEDTIKFIADRAMETRRLSTLDKSIRETGRPMASKFPGKTIYGEQFDTGAQIIYSRDGIVLEK